MLSAKKLAPLAVALLLVLAGCGAGPSDGTTTEPEDTDAPTATNRTTDSPASTDTPDPGNTDTPAGTATPDDEGPPSNETDDRGETSGYSIQVQNGTLPFDVNRTFDRTQTLLGTDVEPRPVAIRNLSEWRGTLPSIAASPLNAALGFENVSVNWSEPTGVTPFTGYVYVHPGQGPPGVVERVLTHEFAHTIQYQGNMLPWLDRLRTGGIMTDQRKTYRALQEGGAVYTADAYAHRHLDVRNNSAFVRERYEQGGATTRSALAPYLFGKQYVADEIDSPANLSAVYEEYPRTTEQVMHNYTREEEPEKDLSVTVETDSEWGLLGNNTLGEMTTRHALGTELSVERAAAAATGWGTDELSVFRNRSDADQFAWVWTHRWDNSSEADEAFDALDEYETARVTDSGRGFETVRVDDGTTAFVFGPESFVDTVSVEGTTANVTVQVGS
ncbi:hypothetical protein BV210_05605 [Halorientalis sp. IM1011]|uniref:hypothetical protein n=1 Tax=Halorientalis sp. IM1011 TaxID=1932360 RepID=UPI00097CD360|nr:hypothetical protein [Halorientalis sp. IM1011]AQL42219.1 hypothetical protein BV210_05605 [Halorientalis sp. IM1011]